MSGEAEVETVPSGDERVTSLIPLLRDGTDDSLSSALEEILSSPPVDMEDNIRLSEALGKRIGARGSGGADDVACRFLARCCTQEEHTSLRYVALGALGPALSRFMSFPALQSAAGLESFLCCVANIRHGNGSNPHDLWARDVDASVPAGSVLNTASEFAHHSHSHSHPGNTTTTKGESNSANSGRRYAAAYNPIDRRFAAPRLTRSALESLGSVAVGANPYGGRPMKGVNGVPIRAGERWNVVAAGLAAWKDAAAHLGRWSRIAVCSAAASVARSGSAGNAGVRGDISEEEWSGWIHAVEMCIHTAMAAGDGEAEGVAREALTALRERAEDDICPAALEMLEIVEQLADAPA